MSSYLKTKFFLVVASVMVFSFLMPEITSASQLTQTSVNLGRLGIGAVTNNNLLVTFKLNSAPTTVSKIVVTFPATFTLTAGTPATGSTFPNTPGSITAPPGLPATATVVSNGAALGGTVTISGLTSASLTNTTLYGFTVTATGGSFTNPATAGQYMTTVASETAGSAVVDSTSDPVYIFGASANQDQVVVSASVAPNFSFSLSANTDTVPQVDPTATKTSPGVTMTVGTNSPLGYTAYVASKNNALTSATSPGTPISGGAYSNAGPPNTMTPGATNYGFVPSTGAACSSCTGSITYDPEYAVVDGTHAGGFNGTNTLASFVSRSGYTNADQILLQERVDVANTVGYANDYTDTLTIVAAGNF